MNIIASGQKYFTTELLIPTFKGRNIHALLRYSQPAEPGITSHHLISLTDISELKNTQQQLQEYADDLKRSNQELEQFAYAASHDLQEPLRMVTSYVQLLEREYKNQLSEDADLMIHFAVDGAKRMKDLIHALLQYSRVGTQGRAFSSVNSEELLSTVLKDLKLVIEESNAEIKYEKLPVILADDIQIRQVFQNLIGNAIKFKGDLAPVIYISCQQTDKEWTFCVRDNGIGIKPEYTGRIFEIFQRLHPRDQYPGTGIGLSLCKRIIERHGGRIFVKSTPAEGSEFYFTIPMNTDERNQ